VTNDSCYCGTHDCLFVQQVAAAAAVLVMVVITAVDAAAVIVTVDKIAFQLKVEHLQKCILLHLCDLNIDP